MALSLLAPTVGLFNITTALSAPWNITLYLFFVFLTLNGPDNRGFQSYKATILLQSNPNIVPEFRLNSTLRPLSTAQTHRKFNFKDTGQRSLSSYWLIIMSFKRRLRGFSDSKATVQVCQLPARLVKTDRSTRVDCPLPMRFSSCFLLVLV